MRKNKKVIIISLICAMSSVNTYSSEINLDFLQGTQSIPSLLKANIKYPAGVYDVDVGMNREGFGRRTLTVTAQDEKKGVLCLPVDWLKQTGITFDPTFYQQVFNAQRQCYALSAEPHTAVDLNLNAQTLALTIPQAYLYAETDSALWDAGESGARIKYDGNFTTSSEQDLSTFGNVDIGLNMGEWRFDTNINASTDGNESSFSSNDMVLSKPLSALRGDLLLGHVLTRSSLFSDFGFYGASVRSNDEMVPWELRGYAPVISGVANSTSRITVTQDGYTIYSKIVSAGPYSLTDIAPVGNGDITVTVKGDNGQETVNTYPIATLPTLLRPEEYKYNMVIGAKKKSTEVSDIFSSNDGLFTLWDIDYGFEDYTLSAATILHQQYQSLGFGVTRSLGDWGAVNADITGATARYDSGEKKKGISAGVKYAKSFTDRTDVQLLAYRYQSSGYEEFADFSPSSSDDIYLGHKKSRYEARISHRLDDFYINGSYWQQRYWGDYGSETGVNVSLNTLLFDRYSLYVNTAYTDNAFNAEPDYSLSLNVSIPFTFNDVKQYSFSSMGYSKENGMTANAGVSASVNDRLNYTVNTSVSDGSAGVAGSLGYAFDKVQTNVSLSQTNSNTTLSGNASGSIIATPKTGVLFTKNTADTVAVVKINDIPDVTFNQSLPTNDKGYAVVDLNSYSTNNIVINPQNVPDDIEVVNASYRVVPTKKAIIYRQFDTAHVQRYILQIKNQQGNVFTGGDALNAKGDRVGFIARNGVLLLNVDSPLNTLQVRDEGKTCHVDMRNVKPGLTTLQEVVCE